MTQIQHKYGGYEQQLPLHLRTMRGMFSGTKLREARERAILSQSDLAERSKVSRQTIARLEDGGPEPFPSTIRKLAKALGIRPQALVEP